MSSSDESILTRVAAHPFFSGMTEHQLRILGDCAQLQQFEAGQFIFRAGDPARGFYLLESGSVAVEGSAPNGRTVLIDTVAAGDPLGWSWMFRPYLCEYSAHVLEPVTAIFIDALRLAEHRGGDLTLGHELFKRMSEVMVRRLSAARSKLVAASATN